MTIEVGLVEGDVLGTRVGDTDGLTLGESDGDADGLAVGLAVRASVRALPVEKATPATVVGGLPTRPLTSFPQHATRRVSRRTPHVCW